MSFMTVEQMQAEIEELKKRLEVLDEFRVASQNKLVAAHEQHCEQLQTENLQLRAVLHMAGQHLSRMKPTPARTIIIGAIRAKLRGEEVDE